MREYLDLFESKQPREVTPFKLGYSSDSLAPVLSKDAVEYHADLARAYGKRYNSGEGDSKFNYAGAFLHPIYFEQLQAPRTGNSPRGEILEFINRKFGSVAEFKDEFQTTAMGIQGSGWAYLARSGQIKTIQNHAVKNDILLLVDWWEHAWAIDYQSNKRKYLANTWKIINWDVISKRLAGE